MAEQQLSAAWWPQEGKQRQAVLMGCAIDELFYGGAAGGGKSDFLVGDFLQDLDQGSNWRGIMFRQTHPELEEIIDRTNEIYPYLGGDFLVGKNVWKFSNGAQLRLRHLETADDFKKYMGHSFSWIGWDELPLMPSLRPYNMMKSRLRGPAQNKRIRSTGNPGGRCHNEVKEYFGIDRWPKGMVPLKDGASGMTRLFIPSKVQDNKILLRDDPGYPQRMLSLGDEELVRAWLDGDWNATVGSYFSRFSKKCIIQPFEVPESWPLFLCMDYGEENPTVAAILAIDYDDRVFVIDEYYRAQTGGADHARGIKAMVENCLFTQKRKMRTSLAPSDMWISRKPGEAGLAWSPKDSFHKEGFFLTKANMDRVNGWRAMKDLLYNERMFFFNGHTEHIVSSISTVQRDPNNPEDVLKGGDDHGADCARYGINHVYKPRKLPKVPHSHSGGAVLDSLTEIGGKVGRYG